MRNTKQRQCVLDNLSKRRDHPTAEMVYQSVKCEISCISLATVYRNLGKLVKEGLVQELPDLGHGRRYDYIDEPHHHFFCTRCGKIEDIYGGLPSSLKESLARQASGKVSLMKLQLFGTCDDCLAGNREDKTQ